MSYHTTPHRRGFDLLKGVLSAQQAGRWIVRDACDPADAIRHLEKALAKENEAAVDRHRIELAGLVIAAVEAGDCRDDVLSEMAGQG